MASAIVTHYETAGRVSVNVHTYVFTSKNRSKTSKIVGVIVVNNEYTPKILDEIVNIRHLFGL